MNARTLASGSEGDSLCAWLDFARSVELQPVCVVARVNQPQLGNLPVEQVVVGDMEDLIQGCHGEADLMLANSHGALLAQQMGVPLVRIGFPIFDRFCEFRRVRQGYVGMRDTLFELANAMQQAHHQLPAYHSPLKQPTPVRVVKEVA